MINRFGVNHESSMNAYIAADPARGTHAMFSGCTRGKKPSHEKKKNQKEKI
jgi:hypothetical protein